MMENPKKWTSAGQCASSYTVQHISCIYIYNQQLPEATGSFDYTVNLAIAQSITFEVIKEKLTQTLNLMTTYYRDNQLKPKCLKIQLLCFPPEKT